MNQKIFVLNISIQEKVGNQKNQKKIIMKVNTLNFQKII